MAKHKIALIPGDGIGKEVLPEGVRVLEAAARRFNFQLEFTEYDWSCDRFAKTGKMMPDDGMETLKQYESIFLGAVERLQIGRKGKPLLYSDGQYAKLASLVHGEPLPAGLDYWGE